MATASPVAKTFDLSTAERELVLSALNSHHAVVKRAMNAETDPTIKEIRQGHLNAVEALSLRFR